MKIKQKKSDFKPIKITLNDREEAEMLRSVVDKVCQFYASDIDFTITKDESILMSVISDAFFDNKVKL